jgi:hypothetical protein
MMSKTPSTMAQAPMTMARTTAVAIGANGHEAENDPENPRIMANQSFRQAGKIGRGVRVADMSRILSELAQ